MNICDFLFIKKKLMESLKFQKYPFVTQSVPYGIDRKLKLNYCKINFDLNLLSRLINFQSINQHDIHERLFYYGKSIFISTIYGTIKLLIGHSYVWMSSCEAAATTTKRSKKITQELPWSVINSHLDIFSTYDLFNEYFSSFEPQTILFFMQSTLSLL